MVGIYISSSLLFLFKVRAAGIDVQSGHQLSNVLLSWYLPSATWINAGIHFVECQRTANITSRKMIHENSSTNMDSNRNTQSVAEQGLGPDRSKELPSIRPP